MKDVTENATVCEPPSNCVGDSELIEYIRNNLVTGQ